MIFGITTIRDEEDVIGPVLRHHLAEGLDRVVVADNLSTDGTRDIIAALAAEDDRVVVVDDTDPGHSHDRKMSALAADAYRQGASWVLPFDADEVWYSPDGRTIAEALADIPEEVTIVRAPGWDHIVTDEQDAPFSPHRRPQHQTLAKVMFRAHPHPVVHFGQHGVEIPGAHIDGALHYRHFQYRSLEQMTRKFRDGREAVEAAGAHPLHCSHWRQGALSTESELQAQWDALCSEEGLVFDPAPFRAEVTA